MYSALSNRWFPELNDGAIFEQNAFSNICLYIKMEHKSALLFWKFQKNVFVNRSSVHCSRGMEVKEETKGNSSVQRCTGTIENQEINNNQMNNQVTKLLIK